MYPQPQKVFWSFVLCSDKHFCRTNGNTILSDFFKISLEF